MSNKVHKLLFISIILACRCGQAPAQPADSAARKTKVIFIAPVQFTENGPGIGITYEQAVNTQKTIALTISGIATFNIANTNRIYNYNTGYYNTGNPDAIYYLLPGVQVYPFGSDHRLSYATGISADIAGGKKSSDFYNYHGQNVAELVQKTYIGGVLLQNYLHYNYTHRVALGAELGVGGSIINHIGGASVAGEFMIQGALKVGYRF